MKWTPEADARARALTDSGLSQDDIGKVLGCSAAAVHSRMVRLRSCDIPVHFDPCDGVESKCGVSNAGASILEPTRSDRLTRLLIVPDCHVPLHDEKAFALMLSVAQHIKPEVIVILGDFADFLSVSSHDRRPDQFVQLKDEVYEVNQALDKLDALGATRKVFCMGNHEHRLERYLVKRAPELFDSVKVPELFKLRERGWECLPYHQHVTIGKVSFIHDTGTSGASAHMRSGAIFESSVIQGHTHRAGINYFGNALGGTHVAASMGWLGSKAAGDYLPPAKIAKDWQLGFGVGYAEPNGVSHIQFVPIIDYRCVVEGRLFS